MKTLQIEGVRCFREEQTIPIRPITLLVGENSSGKSTVLAMVRAAWDVAVGGTEPDFNEDPFGLGGYETIAHYHGGQGARVHDFWIRGTFEPRKASEGERRISAQFTERVGQPSLTTWEASQGEMMWRIQWEKNDAFLTVTRNEELLLNRLSLDGPASSEHRILTARYAIEHRLLERVSNRTKTGSMAADDLLRQFRGIWLYRHRPRPTSSAPIRSKPERTYNPKRDLPEPGGSHVTLTLATLHATDREQFDELATGIAEYANAAGLFYKLDVKRLGRKPGDPFQVMVKVDKHAFNLTDVGYGVSQVLPILFDTLAAPPNQMFLFQQPEVHLHPRAQAALGSLLVRQAVARGQTFVVETHSDHLVDRVRMDVRERIGPRPLLARDVVILYFERKAGQAIVHPIEIDEKGNLRKAPIGYRDFFLEEERRLLGFG